MKSIEFSHLVPFLPTASIAKTISFYRDRLDFDDLWIWDDPPSVIRLGRGPVKFLFSLDPDHPVLKKGFDIMIFMKGLDTLYNEYSDRGLDFSSRLEEKPWGLREFAIRDNNGYLLRFAQD